MSSKGCNSWGERESDWRAKLRSPEAGACCLLATSRQSCTSQAQCRLGIFCAVCCVLPGLGHDCCHAVASILAATAAMAATLWAHQLAWPLVGSEVDTSSGPSADLSCRASQKAAAQTQAKLHGLNSTSTFRNEVAQCQDDSVIGRTMFGWLFPDDWKPPRLNKDPSTMLKSTNEMGVVWSHHHYVGVCYRQVLLMFLLTTTPKMFLHREPVRRWNQQKIQRFTLARSKWLSTESEICLDTTYLHTCSEQSLPILMWNASYVQKTIRLYLTGLSWRADSSKSQNGTSP